MLNSILDSIISLMFVFIHVFIDHHATAHMIMVHVRVVLVVCKQCLHSLLHARGVRIMLEKVADSARKAEIGRTIRTLWRAIPRILLHFFIHIPNMQETYQKKYRNLPIFLPGLSTYMYAYSTHTCSNLHLRSTIRYRTRYTCTCT